MELPRYLHDELDICVVLPPMVEQYPLFFHLSKPARLSEFRLWPLTGNRQLEVRRRQPPQPRHAEPHAGRGGTLPTIIGTAGGMPAPADDLCDPQPKAQKCCCSHEPPSQNPQGCLKLFFFVRADFSPRKKVSMG